MRKVFATELLTLDGVMEAPDQWSFQFRSDEAGQFKFDELRATDALLLGRVTYEGFAASWPTMEGTGEFGERMNGLPKYVVTTTLNELSWNNSYPIKGDVAAEVAALKQQPGQDIAIYGSADLVRSLMQLGLIGEYRLMIFPVVVGKGKRLFPDEGEQTALKLVDSKTFASGVVVLTYEPAPAGQAAEGSVPSE